MELKLRRAARFLCLFLLLGSVAEPASARLLAPDPSFGDQGTVGATPVVTSVGSEFLAIQLESGGSFLALHHSSNDGENDLWRFEPDGTPDPAFEHSSVSVGNLEAVDAAGRTLRKSGRSLRRFEPDGSLDGSFGDPTGHYSDELSFPIEAILPLPSGQIAVAGAVLRRKRGEVVGVERVEIAMLDPQGHLDPSFGGGTVRLGAGQGLAGERVRGLFPGRSGGVVAVIDEHLPTWRGDAATHSGSLLVALGASGGLDVGYGNGGVVRSADSITAFSTTASGGVTVAGDHWTRKLARGSSRDSDFAARRLTADGKPDPGFGGGDGAVELDLGGLDLVHSLLEAGDGSLVLGGATTPTTANCTGYGEPFCTETPVLVRLGPGGGTEAGFGTGGVRRFPTLAGDHAYLPAGRGVLALAPRSGGGMLAAGGSGGAAFVAAVGADGALDPDFGDGGVFAERETERGESEAHAIAVDRRGRILVAGAYGELSAVYRFLPNGRVDRGYGDGHGFVRVPGNARAISVGPAGDAFVLSGKYAPGIVTHLTARGRFDDGFGREGSASMPPDRTIVGRRGRRLLVFDPRSVVALRDGGVLVGGEAGGEGLGSNPTRIELVRFDSKGRLDRGFGRRGQVFLALGYQGNCNLRQVAVRPDGRILIAGLVRRRPRPHSRNLAVIGLRPDGTLDRGFGRRGRFELRSRADTDATALTIQSKGGILVGGRVRGTHSRMLLLRLSPDGRRDRGFARQVARRLPTRGNHGGGAEPRRILPIHDRIVVWRRNAPKPLLVYSSSGRLLGAREYGGSGKRRSWIAALTAQRGRLLIAANRSGRRRAFELTRHRVTGR